MKTILLTVGYFLMWFNIPCAKTQVIEKQVIITHTQDEKGKIIKTDTVVKWDSSPKADFDWDDDDLIFQFHHNPDKHFKCLDHLDSIKCIDIDKMIELHETEFEKAQIIFEHRMKELGKLDSVLETNKFEHFEKLAIPFPPNISVPMICDSVFKQMRKLRSGDIANKIIIISDGDTVILKGLNDSVCTPYIITQKGNKTQKTKRVKVLIDKIQICDITTDEKDKLTQMGVKIGKLSENEDFELNVHPNPVKEKIVVSFNMKKAGNVKLEVYTIEGKSVFSATEKALPGKFEKEIDMSNLKNGPYFLMVNYNNQIMVKKLMVGK